MTDAQKIAFTSIALATEQTRKAKQILRFVKPPGGPRPSHQ
jgi:hypothetical protein